MKKFNEYSMTGLSASDRDAIMNCLECEIPLFVDEYGRVFAEGGEYVADAKETELGNGIGC